MEFKELSVGDWFIYTNEYGEPNRGIKISGRVEENSYIFVKNEFICLAENTDCEFLTKFEIAYLLGKKYNFFKDVDIGMVYFIEQQGQTYCEVKVNTSTAVCIWQSNFDFNNNMGCIFYTYHLQPIVVNEYINLYFPENDRI